MTVNPLASEYTAARLAKVEISGQAQFHRTSEHRENFARRSFHASKGRSQVSKLGRDACAKGVTQFDFTAVFSRKSR